MGSRVLRRAAGVGMFLCLLSGLGCSDKSTNGDVDLPPAPAGVTDLRVTSTAPDWVRLAWTAPLDDESHGPVSGYDIRYTDFAPGEGDWDDATQVNWTSQPMPGGFTETVDVTGLTSGATYYFALKCCDNHDQCSPASNLVEATLPVEFEVDFPDPALEAAIREALDQPSGAIMYSAALTITALSSESGGIADLTGLQYCENLQYLFLLGNKIEDLEPISALSNLRTLNLNGSDLDDISLLSGLTGMQQLDLGFNAIDDITSLASLTDLTSLVLHDNNIVDIGALAVLTQLQYLDVSYNQIADIGPLVANTGLGEGDTILLAGNLLSTTSLETHIPALEARGVTVDN